MLPLKRVLALALIPALALSMPAALAEAEPGDDAAELVIEILQEGEPSPEPTAEPTIEPTPEPTPEPTRAPGADTMLKFSRGYARVDADTFGYDGASPAARRKYYLGGGIVYADGRKTASGCDRILICFDGGEGEITTWVNARDLAPLSEEAAQRFISEIGDSCLRGGNPALPLGEIACSDVITVPGASPTGKNTPAMLVEQTELILCEGQSIALGVSFSDGERHGVTFTSQNSAIAAVDEGGMVTGKARGSTAIVLSGEFGNEIRVAVVVKTAGGCAKNG